MQLIQLMTAVKNKVLSLRRTHKVGVAILMLISTFFAIPNVNSITNAAASCSPVYTQAIFNPYPVDFSAAGLDCHDRPAITARVLTPGGDYPRSQSAYFNGITAHAGQEVEVLMYVHNGAADNIGSAVTARNVVVTNSFGTQEREVHHMRASFSSPDAVNSPFDNTKTQFADILINTASNERLEHIAGSGRIFNYQGNQISSGHNFGNNSFSLGDIQACFEFAKFMSFRVRVVGPAQQPNGTLDVQKDVDNADVAGKNYVDSLNLTGSANVEYRIRVTNTSNVTLNNVRILDNVQTLPGVGQNGQFTSDPLGVGGGVANGFVLDTLAAGATQTITYPAVIFGTTASVVNTVSAIADNAPQDTDTATVTVSQAPQNPNLTISKLVRNVTRGQSVFQSVTNALPNEVVEYKVTVGNSGGTASDVRIVDQFNYAGITLDVNSIIPAGSGTLTDPNQGITIATLGSNQSTTVTYRAQVNSNTTPRDIVNTATVTAASQNNNRTAPISASATVRVDAVAPTTTTINVTKQVSNITQGIAPASQVTARSGDQLTYQVIVQNTGSNPATNLRITDSILSLNPNINLVAGSVSVSRASNANGTIPASGIVLASALAANDSVSITYSATVGNGVTSGNFVNTAVATADNAPSRQAQATVNVSAPLPQNATLQVTKEVRNVTDSNNGSFADQTNARRGEIVQYRVRVTNTSTTTAAQNVTLRDQMNAAGITLGTVTGYSGDLSSGLQLGTILGGTTITILYTGTVNVDNTTITNTATAQGTNTNQATDTARVIIAAAPVGQASLQVTKEVSTNNGASYAPSASVNQNTQVQYRITVRNTGTIAATGVTISDTISNLTGVTYNANSTTTTGGSGNFANGSVVTLTNSLAANATATVTYTATITGNPGSTITNTARAQANNAGQASASATVTVQQPNVQRTTLDVIKDVKNVTTDPNGVTYTDVVNASQNDTVEYRVRITNTGTANATGLSLIDVLPSAVTANGFVNISSGFTFSGVLSNLSLNGTLTPNQTVTLTYRAIVNQSTAGDITNTARAQASNADPDSDTAVVRIQAQNQNTSLSLLKEVRNVTTNGGFGDTVNARNGETVEYRLTIRNTGSVAASNIVVTDSRPSGISFTGFQVINGLTGNGSINSGSGITMNGSLGAGNTFTVLYQATVNQSSGSVLNTATASASNAGSISDTATVFLTGDNQTTLSLQKNVRNLNSGNFSFVKSIGNVRNNDIVEFRLDVTNIGSTTASNVLVTDLVPSGLVFQNGSVSTSQGSNNNTDNLNTGSGLSIGDLNVGSTATIYFRARVSQSFVSNITNVARARANNASEVTSQAIVGVINDNPNNGGLNIIKRVRNLSNNNNTFSTSVNAQAGDRIEYQITVSATNGPVSNVLLYEGIPSGMTMVSSSARLDGDFLSDFFLTSNQAIDLVSLQNGETVVLLFQTTVNNNSNFQNVITNTARATGSNVPDVSATASVNLNGGSLSISKLVRNVTAGNNSFQNSVNAATGDRVAFEITVLNLNNQTINNVRLSDTLPFGLTLDTNTVFLDNARQSVANNTNTLDLFLGSLFGNTQRRLVFEATVNNTGSTNSTSLQNIARVSGDNANQTQDDAFVILGTTTNLLFSKRAFNDTRNVDAVTVPAQREDFITYTLTATNNTGSTVNNFVITDDLSGVLPYADIVDNGGGTVNGNTITFPAVTIAPGASVSKNFRVRVKFALASSQSFTMTNSYGNLVTIAIAGETRLVAPPTGSSAASAMTFSGLLTAGFIAFRKRRELMSLIFV